MRNTQTGTPSAQRISDWKAGRNVPARFESLLPVILTLVELTEKAQHQLPRRLADPHEWRRLWQESVTWTATASEGDTCPYPGLRAFRAEERALFFGREQATTAFVDLVRATTGIVVLIGASGAGKSSLLAAGLRPALDLPSATMTPGTAPTAGLAAALGPDLRVLVVDQFEELFTLCPDEAERSAFLTALAELTSRPRDPLTVVLALRADFYERCLHHPILRDSLQHNDYLLGPMSLDEVSRAITGPAAAAGLTLEQGLEELVLTELRGLGAHADTDGYDPGALPLLSHVMAATWQQREGRKLTVAGYRTAGAVAGSVAETAESAWSELTPAQQDAAQELLGSLVTVGQDTRDTRRVVGRTELLARGADPTAAGQALDVLAASRLLALDADSVQFSHEIVLTAWPRLRGWIDTDRVGHLVRQRLETDATEWEAAARDPALLYRGTRLDSANEHARGTATSPRARAFLDASGRSARFGRRRRAGAAAVVLALLATGVVAWDRGKLADQRTADRDYTELVAAAQRSRTSDPSLSAQLSLAAFRMRPDPASRTQLLNSQELPLATTIPAHDQQIDTLVARPADGLLVSIDLARHARFWDTTDARRPRRIASDFAVPIDVLAFVPGGTGAVTNGPSGVQWWDFARPEAPRLLQTLTPGRRQSMAVSPRGTHLVESDATTVTFWSLGERPGPVRRIELPGDGSAHVQSVVEFSPDGALLAIGRLVFDTGAPDVVQLWDVRDPVTARPVGAPIVIPGSDHFRDLAFSPDATMLAVGTYGSAEAAGPQSSRVELWQVTDPDRPRRYGSPFRVDNDVLHSIAFTGHGTGLATSSAEAGRLWNIIDPAQPEPAGPALAVSPGPCLQAVASVCDSGPRSLIELPGTSTLAGAGNDGSLRLWTMPRSMVTTAPHSSFTPVFDQAGDRMAVLSASGSLVVWDTSDPRRPVRVTTIAGAPGRSDPALSSDGRTLSVHDRYGAQRLVFALDDPAAPRPLAPWPADDTTESIVEGDRMMVIHGSTLQLWDVTDRAAPVRRGAPLTATHGQFSSGRFAADGDRLETMSYDPGDSAQPYLRQIWSLADPDHPRLIGTVDAHATTTFQPSQLLPDNRTMIVTEFDNFRLWAVAEPGSIAPLTDPIRTEMSPIISLSTAIGGDSLALSSDDGTTVLWSIEDPRAPHKGVGPIGPADGRNRRVVVHPDGEQLVVITDNGQLGVWELDPEQVAARICAATGDALTEPVWHRQVPNVSYRPPCA
ncbi:MULTISPECIES: NACHT and WD repeat domain-containing protein [unclassified Nocardia]|uniref:NACHT and WD repeat domain-containing protein n=1 Tax=unclassified Nocardia TaxID=2637762 RepID=UPI001C4E47C7|nr:NACHT and WD repeat domain-containing protein [Nocardia sp. MH4]